MTTLLAPLKSLGTLVLYKSDYYNNVIASK